MIWKQKIQTTSGGGPEPKEKPEVPLPKREININFPILKENKQNNI